jgi:hypothetical protein
VALGDRLASQWVSVSRTALDTKTSEFVSMHLGPDGVQSRHKGLYWFAQKISLRPVDIAAHVALHQVAHSRGYKRSREGADPRSLWWWMSMSVHTVSCVLHWSSP